MIEQRSLPLLQALFRKEINCAPKGKITTENFELEPFGRNGVEYHRKEEGERKVRLVRGNMMIFLSERVITVSPDEIRSEMRQKCEEEVPYPHLEYTWGEDGNLEVRIDFSGASFAIFKKERGEYKVTTSQEVDSDTSQEILKILRSRGELFGNVLEYDIDFKTRVQELITSTSEAVDLIKELGIIEKLKVQLHIQ